MCPSPYVVFLVLRSCSADSKFATFPSVLQLCCKGTKNFWIYQILCQRIQLNLFKMMSAAKIQQQAKLFRNYFSKNCKKMPSRGEWQFPRERAATSLHLFSKQTSAALVILSLLFLVHVYGTLSPILYHNY